MVVSEVLAPLDVAAVGLVLLHRVVCVVVEVADVTQVLELGRPGRLHLLGQQRGEVHASKPRVLLHRLRTALEVKGTDCSTRAIE